MRSSTPTNESSAELPTAPATHYDLFPATLPDGPPPRGHFPIDVRALRREFLQLQAKAHPDRHPPKLKSQAQATSARINEAFKTLSHPLLRAQYLLSLQGIDVAKDETTKVEDPGLLMTVIEAREEIEEAQDESQLHDMRNTNDERIRGSEGILERAFRSHDIEKAKLESIRLRYWINIKESLDNWEKGKHITLEH
jgi:molecular chaperone HscB